MYCFLFFLGFSLGLRHLLVVKLITPTVPRQQLAAWFNLFGANNRHRLTILHLADGVTFGEPHVRLLLRARNAVNVTSHEVGLVLGIQVLLPHLQHV